MAYPRRHGPPTPRFPTGPRCGAYTDEISGVVHPECPYRATSFGYAPYSGNCDTSTFLFLLEALGADEVEAGAPAVGPTGGIFNKLLHENTPILRSEQVVANVVCCRPVEWESDDKGGQRTVRQEWSGDMVNAKPSAGQIRECWTRYGKPLLEAFQGKYIIGLGKTPIHAMTGHPYSISKLRGTIFEPGELVPCVTCNGSGKVSGRTVKCKECKGHGTLKCPTCAKWTKHGKKCGASNFTQCLECKGTASVPGKTKNCLECDGAGRTSKDPDNVYVCEQLKPGQLLFPTYHPAMLMREPTMWPVVARDFSRMATLENELHISNATTIHEFPPAGATLEMLQARSFSVDIETSGGLDPSEGDIVCVGATDRIGTGYVFDPDDERVARVLSGDEIVGQNFVLYDQWWLYNKGHHIPETTKIWDTRYAGKLCNPDTPNDLVYLTGEFANPPIRGYWKTTQNYRHHKPRVACIDVDATLRVAQGQRDYLKWTGQLSLMENYIIPLSRVTFEMRAAGMKIDKSRMKDASAAIEKTLVEERAFLPDWGGTRTENQHARVQEYLYETLKLPTQKKRGTGRPTANAEALEELRSRLQTGHKSVKHVNEEDTDDGISFINRILELRDMSKLQTSFLRYRLSGSFVHPALSLGGSAKGKHESGRGTASFRFSCTDPNAQQIPDCRCSKKCYGTNLDCRGARYIFIPDQPDWEVMSVDLAQAEIVGFLYLAEEWGILKKVLHEGLDAHQAVANQILGRDASKPERDDFKTTTFAILFGEQERTTAARLHRSLDEIHAARDAYFKMLPGVDDYRTSVIESCKRRGYVESPFGFRRYIRLDRSTGRAANQACNAPIQNIPPTVIGKAMLRMYRQLPKPARLWMQVHDEVLIVYPKNLREAVRDCALSNLRAEVPEMPAPVLGMAGGLKFNVDCEIGPNWGALRKYSEVVGMEREGKNPWIPTS